MALGQRSAARWRMLATSIAKALAPEIPMVQLCRRYGISRKTGYKWLERFETRGLEALVDESRWPDTSPVQTTADVAVEIIKLRQLHPTWRPRKLQRRRRNLNRQSARPSPPRPCAPR